mgnify:CR=1 FL=1
MDFTPYLDMMIRKKASDVFVTAGCPVRIKIEGKLRDIDTSAAAQTVLGMVAWLVKWYKPGGRLSAERAAEVMEEVQGGLGLPPGMDLGGMLG